MTKEPERDTQAFLKRACSGRWPLWRLLGMKRHENSLALAVEWLRRQATLYSLVLVALDKFEFSWSNFSTAADARAALAALEAKPQSPPAPAAPVAASAGR